MKKAKAWSPAEKATCMKLFKRGLPDSDVTKEMKKKFPRRKWSPHSIRSYRGRIERAGLLAKGTSGSSKVTKKAVKKAVKKPPKEAALRLVIDVVYLLHKVPLEELEARLGNIPIRAAGNGSFTGSTAAEVKTWGWKVLKRRT